MAVLPLNEFVNRSVMLSNWRFEAGTTTLRMPDGESVWELFVNRYAGRLVRPANTDQIEVHLVTSR
jgi:hypothetical protein